MVAYPKSLLAKAFLVSYKLSCLGWPCQFGAQGEGMTINIAVATLDAIVLGCDSLSSVMSPMMNLSGIQPAVDASGAAILDKDGKPVFAFDHNRVDHYPVNVFGGVSKMFLLYEDKDTSVAAVTSNQGSVNGRTIAALASEYKRACETNRKAFETVEDVAKDFLEFMVEEWMRQPHIQSLPATMVPMFGTVNFIVGGFGKRDAHGQVYKLDVAQKEVKSAFNAGSNYGVTWGGQANFVERLLKGSDSRLEGLVKRNILEALAAQRNSIVQSVLDGLVQAGVEIPGDINFAIQEVLPTADPWDSYWAEVDYANLPVQYAVDLASLLVNIQSGMQHFGRGIATVGGRTHIGVLQRNSSFKKLKEPKLAHSHTGYSHEL